MLLCESLGDNSSRLTLLHSFTTLQDSKRSISPTRGIGETTARTGK